LPHVNATMVPFNVADLAESQRALRHPEAILKRPRPEKAASPGARYAEVSGTTPIAQLAYRGRAKVAGRVRAVRVRPGADAPALECTLTDASGGEVMVVFMGRKDVPGIRTGTQMVVDGMVGERRGQLAILNPIYELLVVPETESAPGA
jgi:hypothetical protein